ncbi:PIN domain-containing protein [Desulfofundulus thermosubterraneus]|uniref:PIN domain-containing protein n=1 Tax=Desulfofundulus thermosubterraneus DSM 16057 TaxID=1121432 RepID=A0A1M6FRF3_9FIRM|nr:PIN domain-containing protein [Desulfofundulus thermosubterraneus]SHJ00209.1 protein of unknown function [Desulfofundulus thermosubterraneus DSM 16057]
MTDFPPTLVVDANIWIDLDAGELLPLIFHLPFRLVSPDVIVAELKKPNGKELVKMGLLSVELGRSQIEEVMRLRSAHRKPGTVDLFALALAKTEGLTLLTGDKNLRVAARKECVTVHGTLWLLEQLVKYRIISVREAAEALAKMITKGSRLPLDECKRCLKRWTKSYGQNLQGHSCCTAHGEKA